MDAKVRIRVAMGVASRDFAQTHPVDNPEFKLVLGELDEFIGLAQTLATEQREGHIDRHAASLRKRELEAQIRQVHLPHLVRAGRSAAADDHELASAFTRKPASNTFAAIRNAAGGMAETAEQHKDVMIKGGMSTMVLEDLQRAIREFDAAVQLGNTGLAKHVGAGARLKAVGDQIVRRVGLLDAIYRLAFRNDQAVLAAWGVVSHVRALPRTEAETPEESQPGSTPPESPGDVRPAA
jgi:hypothetical protein